MALFKIQGKAEKNDSIYYEFDTDNPPLGEGGMGRVYKGRCVNEKSGQARDVAVKFLNEEAAANSYVVEKARREAAMKFKHDNLVEMLGFVETEEKTFLGEVRYHYHVVSELLVGVSLDNLLSGKLTDQHGNYVPYAEKIFKESKQNPELFAIEMVKSVLSGLMFMHDNGFIHRDIDPTNIMITSDGRIKLIDFGIAKKMSLLTTNDKSMTQSGQFIGKPDYAAPELVLGSLKEQNQTTDIYAMGILLFQCITGHTPFKGDSADVLQMQLHKPIPLLQIKNKGLRSIIKKATEKKRSERYQSAAEFRVDLDRVAKEIINHNQNDNSNSRKVKPFMLYTFVAVVAVIIVAACIFKFILPLIVKPQQKIVVEPLPIIEDSVIEPGKISLEKNVPIISVEGVDCETIKLNLYKGLTAEDGIKNLKILSDNGNSEASYLLSRIYFRSKLEKEFFPDSILKIQENLKRNNVAINVDYDYAHRMLQKAVEQNPENYKALYELGCDFWKADQRTDAVKTRDGKRAEELFRNARNIALNVSDRKYMQLIDNLLKRVDAWKKNIIKDRLKN